MRVVIAPATSVTGEVHECLRSWSAAGLLERFCIWQIPVDAQPEDARCVVRIDNGVDHLGTLPEALQDTPSDQVILLGFYATDDSEAFDPRFSARVSECMQHAANVLAYDKTRPVECAMIVAPGRISQPVPVDVFCGSWNLYVAPEDRSTPRAANQLPDSDGFLPRHAAHALATVADLWVDASTGSSGVLEAVANEDVYAIDPPAVRLVRCFSRMADYGYMADHVAAGVFQAGDEWSNPDPDHFDRVSEPARLVKQAVREFMEIHGETIGLTRFEPLKLPPEKRPSLLEALRELIGMMMARIRRIPSDLADATLGSAHDRLADRIDRLRGPDAPRTLRWRERPEAERNLTDIADQLVNPFPTPDGPTDAVWRDLRQLAFALVDGSDLPDGMDASSYSRSGKQALVTKPAALVPDPQEKPPDRLTDRACDPRQHDPRLSDDPGEGDPGANTGETVMKDWVEGRRPTLLWAVGYEIASALKAAGTAAAELDAEADATLAAKDGKDAGEAEDDEQAEGADDDASAGSTPPKEHRWRRLRNALLINIAIAIFASLLIWTRLDPVPALAAQLIVVLAWTFGFMSLALRFVRLERSILRAEVESQLEVANTAMRRALCAGDEPRLERRYAEYLDWAEIIGWMVHQPWVGEPIGRVEVLGAIPRSTLPAAFRVGVAKIPEPTLEKLCGQARAKVFQTRWLTAQYRAVADEAMARLALTYSYSGAGGAPDPDADDRDDSDSPRRQLLAAIRRGDGRSLRDNEMTSQVLRFIDRLPLDSAADEVKSPYMARADSDGSVDDQLSPLPPCAAWFAPPASLPDLAPRILGAVIRITVDSATGPRIGLGAMLAPEGLAVTSLSVVAEAQTVRVTLADGSHREAATVRALPEADLALLKLEGEVEPLEEPLVLSDSEALLGDPILAPSPPGGDASDPAVALGLVTAQYGRRANGPGTESSMIGATYRTAAGPAGSPVFDLEGRLVGIHRSATLDGDNRDLSAARTVVQVSVVKALLNDELADDSEAATHAVSPARERELEARTDAEVVTAKPSMFLGDLFPPGDGPEGLLPHHWVDPDDQHLIEMVGEEPVLAGAELGGLSTGARFMQPLRVLVHRIDMTQAVAARELASCAVEESDASPRLNISRPGHEPAT